MNEISFFRIKMEEKLRALHEECQLARNTMINLSERLRSFSNWPLTGKVSKQAMAEAGWFQVGDLSARHVVTMKELGGWEGKSDIKIILILLHSQNFTCNFF